MLNDVTLVRQPILDRHMTIIGYELILHPLNSDVEPNMKTLENIHNTYDLATLAGGARVFLPSNQISLEPRLLNLCSDPKKLVIEVTVDVANSVDKLRLLKQLRIGGATLTLKDYRPEGHYAKVASACQMVKIKTSDFDITSLSKMVRDLHSNTNLVIADDVANEDQFHQLKDIGFDFFQGYCFTNPIIVHGKKLSANKLNLLQLLAKVNNEGTDIEELSELISHDVALSHKLLTAINHPKQNIPIQVTSISDAIRYMGLKRLKLWISMILMSEVEDKPQALLITSLVRARFCELLAEHSSHRLDKDSFFLVGLFSTLGAFFDLPQSEVVDELPLSSEIKLAMTDYEGASGKALRLAKQLENAYTDLMSLSFENLDIMGVSNDFLSATHWGESMLNQNISK
jgi:EAL and modified HD-GYP domain-containing signal transduction protein